MTSTLPGSDSRIPTDTVLKDSAVSWPCPRHQTVGVDPDACQHCGVPRHRHFQRWTGGVGRHGWTTLTDAQRLARMRARREVRGVSP